MLECEGKARYNKKAALSAVNRRTRGRSEYRHNRPDFLRAYPCPHCNGWHLTKRR